MAYISENGTDTITCDKCGATDYATTGNAGKVFFNSGWALFPNAKKYVQVCYNCLSKKQKKTTDWARKAFPTD
jgi:thymidine kinase